LQRDLSALENGVFDLVVIGGGIFGVCSAWDAALRGLSVALVERRDFAGATSANSFKMVHGGIRYLQHGDLVRIRQSSQERNVLLRIAPHLVQPLPIVIPTYGHGMKGKEVLLAGLFLYDLLTLDRNWGIRDKEQRIPNGCSMSRQELLNMFPDLDQQGLTGGVLFSDAQMYNPPRLALSFLKSAVELGAKVANYVEAIDFLRSGDRISGVRARDGITGSPLEIRGKVVLNAAGPWAETLLEKSTNLHLSSPGTYSRDACFVVPRRLTGKYALAVSGRTKDPDAILSRSARHLFIVPWRDYSLVGVWHVVHQGLPDEFAVTEQDLQSFLEEINQAYPSLKFTLDDVSISNAGLVLFGDNKPGAKHLSYGKRSRIIDHSSEHHLEGLVTLIGVRYTTARAEASKAIDLVSKKLQRISPRSKTSSTPIWGGDMEHFGGFLRNVIGQRPIGLGVETLQALSHNYGSGYPEVLKYARDKASLAEPIGTSRVLKAEIVHAVREEMALKLADVVFRRTDLATGAHPGEDALRVCATLMASELHWDSCRTQNELHEVNAMFPQLQTV
jgi:glycerol-3-phosphate dehydrogenase